MNDVVRRHAIRGSREATLRKHCSFICTSVLLCVFTSFFFLFGEKGFGGEAHERRAVYLCADFRRGTNYKHQLL